MAAFPPITIADNPDGWGPTALPESLLNFPYHVYSKGERLGKVADWTGQLNQQSDRRGGPGRGGPQQFHAAAEAERDEDALSSLVGGASAMDANFQLVDTSRVQRPIYQKMKMKQQQAKQNRARQAQMAAAAAQAAQNPSTYGMTKSQKFHEMERQRKYRQWVKNSSRFTQQMQPGQQRMQQGQGFGQQQNQRQSSVAVKDKWEGKEDFDYPRLSKLTTSSVSAPEDLVTCGALDYFERTFDRVTTKNERRLQRINRIFHTVTTTDDPVIRRLSKQNVAEVFATDSIIATLMCATRSVNSWDILVTRVGNKLFFDKRDKSDFDLLTVNETAADPPKEDPQPAPGATAPPPKDMNSRRNLSLEATYVQHNFSQQVLSRPLLAAGAEGAGETATNKYTFDEPNPFIEPNTDPNTIASVGYKYRKWKLTEEVSVVVRCELDAVTTGATGETQTLLVRALNEWALGGALDWRTRLDTQRGAVLAAEIKNNSCKLAKWTVCALLAGVDLLKFGYVSRVHSKDNTQHTILGIQHFKAQEFANQLNLHMENCWGVLRCIVDTCLKQPAGKYILVKDPSKTIVRLYALPPDAFESEEESEESEEEDSGSEEEDQAAAAEGGETKKE